MAGQVGDAAARGRRAMLGLAGALAGLSYWLLAEHPPALLADPRAYLVAATLTFGFFAAFFALSGPLGLRGALLLAPGPALLSSLMLSWAGLRYGTATEVLVRPGHPVAYALLLALPLPYLIAARRAGTGTGTGTRTGTGTGAGWRDYPTLFSESWGIVVRLAAAALFAGLAWLAVYLADELLQLVGIDLVRQLIEVDWLPAAFTGLVAGLALGIVNEMDDLVSPALVLRLLRLLVLPAFLVVGAFTVAVPVQGLDRLFGLLSPAATLIGIALVLALLISTAVDARDAAAAQGPLTRAAVRGLALLMPMIAALALLALRLRIGDDGLSPARLAAVLGAGVLLAYGVCYALSVLMGPRWMARIRAVNGWMALGLIALAALWLSPALNAERLSAGDQVRRLASGRTAAAEADLWTLRHDWGRAGTAAIARIEALAQGHPEEELLRQRLAYSAQAPDRAAFWNSRRDAASLGARAELKRLMPVQPPEAAEEFDRYVLPWYAGSVASFLDGCRDVTGSGRPGCVLVVHDLVPDNPGNEAILFYKSFGLLRGEVIVPEPVFRRADAAEIFSVPPPDFEETDALIEALQDGGFSAGPARINAITIGERQFTVPF